MSFEINWEHLVGDGSVNESIKQFLDKQFSDLVLPSYINDLSVKAFSLGTNPPEVTIRHIGDPFEEFYKKEDDEDENTNSNVNSNSNNNNNNSNSNKEVFHVESDSDSDSDDEGEEYDLQDLSEDREIRSNTTMGGPGDREIQNQIKQEESSVQASIQTGSSGDPTTGLLNGLNYSMNNLGILNNINRSETPTNILSHPQNPYSSTLMQRKAVSDVNNSKSDNDIQFIAEIKYQGDLHLEINVNLLVNYPSPNFITLPIKLHVTDLNIHSIVAIAYLSNSVFLSFLCDIDDNNSMDYFNTNHGASNPSGGNFVEYFSGGQQERIDIIKRVRIESEIGEVEQNVLRNVGKVEKFLVEQLRTILRDEVAWPSWICLDMGDGDESDDE
ncbi:mitochondrial distribution and morphology protein 12 [[Candida] railenensis]|uniref:Mitochondrial distribution and morphology protein 12 n=1 Tax=[Candida] railenensis TaxID=45579 RepID=A0A9P0QSE6_9ASCO|nr:mitochondrial distribution and morphology protein 12 [[Candida] railenensis]